MTVKKLELTGKKRGANVNEEQKQALDVIQNFILWYTSGETERDRMYKAALTYVEQDHVLNGEAA